jgi:hypothetical protein
VGADEHRRPGGPGCGDDLHRRLDAERVDAVERLVEQQQRGS